MDAMPATSIAAESCHLARGSGMVWGDRRTQRVPRPVLLQVEDFLQHGETLAVLLVGDGFEKAAHGLLPALVDGVFVEFVCQRWLTGSLSSSSQALSKSSVRRTRVRS